MKKRIKTSKKNIKLNKFLKYFEKSFTGGFLILILYLLITLLGKYNILNLSFMFKLYGKIGYDINLFGILTGAILGFFTGFFLFLIYFIFKDSIKK